MSADCPICGVRINVNIPTYHERGCPNVGPDGDTRDEEIAALKRRVAALERAQGTKA